MVKVKIKQEFHDIKNYSKVYLIDEVYEFPKERASRLIELGLVEKIEIETTTKRSKKEK